MSDNPKSLASLADDLEHGLTPAEMERVCRYVASKGWQGNLPYMRATLAAIEDAGFAVVPREAAAALRAPTIAAVTDEMVDAALTEYVGEPPFEDYFGEEGVGPHRLNMRAALEAALATPSPTIAAPSPSNEVTAEMLDAALEAFVESENVPDTRHDTEAMRLAIEAALKARKPKDDTAVEWVMCAVRDAMREHNFVVERGSDLWNRLRRHIEAALDGWHDGAGQ